MPSRQSHLDAFKRIVEIADRKHLYLPFQRDSQLRAKYFPGSGPHIARSRLIEAYAREFVAQAPDEKLLQHAAWPWIHGYDASLTHILDDLKAHRDHPPEELAADRRRALEKRFTRVGAEEIAAFWTLYAAGDDAYRKSIIGRLADVKPPEIASPPTLPTTPKPDRAKPAETPAEQTPDPTSQSAYALFGVLAFLIPSLILVGIQYWRQPGQSHWIVLSIAGLFGLLTLIFLIDFLRKRNL